MMRFSLPGYLLYLKLVLSHLPRCLVGGRGSDSDSDLVCWGWDERGINMISLSFLIELVKHAFCIFVRGDIFGGEVLRDANRAPYVCLFVCCKALRSAEGSITQTSVRSVKPSKTPY